MNQTLSGPQSELHALAESYGIAPAAVAAIEALIEAHRLEAAALGQDDERYVVEALLGRGAMGEVHRVRDVRLGRQVAMKRVLSVKDHARARFMAEALAAAQLQHPSIVPVYEVGELEDGRPWFTMPEIEGETLTEAVSALHEANAVEPTHWTLRALVEAFARVCEAVAYAHARGVIHRDLKPDNIMLGSFGQVFVLDWGLVRVTGEGDATGLGAPVDLEGTEGEAGLGHTVAGNIVGTPGFIAPELLLGEPATAQSDVYALGVVLYYMLTHRQPHRAPSAMALLMKTLSEPPDPVDELDGLGRPVPAELVRIATRALSKGPEVRYADAAALAFDVRRWLDGTRDRERALELVERAVRRLTEQREFERRAAELRAESLAALAAIPSWADEETKVPAWTLTAQADTLAAHAGRRAIEATQLLQAALALTSDLPEAHALLAEHHLERHRQAEAAGDEAGTARAEAVIQRHALSLPAAHPVRARATSWLRGVGHLTLHTSPPGAEALLFRYAPHRRRLDPVFERSLGHTPLLEVELPIGSTLIVLRHPEAHDVRYPVLIERQRHHDGLRPGSPGPCPILLPPLGSLGPDEVYVPGGWCLIGEEGSENALRRQRVWVDGFVMERFPVTNRRFMAFLDALVADGREELAERLAPAERAGTWRGRGEMIYGRAPDGRFILRPDEDGDMWEPDWPVLMVDRAAAVAFATWQAQISGLPWRLPSEVEWEKAARGTDGRPYPFGEHLDPSWCNMKNSHPGRPLPSAVTAFPIDESPWGVRGLAGNVMDWCADAHPTRDVWLDGQIAPVIPLPDDDGDVGIVRGGAWFRAAQFCRATRRTLTGVRGRDSDIGFRLVR